MKVAIVGAGASGIILGIKLKLNNPKNEIIIIDKNKKVGKKLLMTGNGKCNLGNTQIMKNTYRDEKVTNLIFNKYSFEKQRLFFNSLGIKTKFINNLCYPYSESAKSVVDILYEIANNLGVKFQLEETITDYQRRNVIKVITDKNSYIVDRLVFATGGVTYPKSGSDGSVFELLKRHGHSISNIYPGLCPIKTKERTKEITGIRVKGEVSLYLDNKFEHKEQGEILFKDDGLSGIAIMNMSSLITRNMNRFDVAKLSLDLFPTKMESTLFDEFRNSNNFGFSFLKGYFIADLANYILKRANCSVNQVEFTDQEIRSVVKQCKNLDFTFKGLDDFNNAQVTIGGVTSKLINADLESKIENRVHFVGEIIDNDGLCGGYNLMWAFGSALYLGDRLCK